jgi:hypothetical protein
MIYYQCDYIANVCFIYIYLFSKWSEKNIAREIQAEQICSDNVFGRIAYCTNFMATDLFLTG